ncbi:MAG TPA: GAF domain-containing protein, partial [Candidatus Lokiarchaeia archaeon]|nr:GAF domain-containing protein [Candidatus Lokiarchaeia archaeon]
MAVPEQNVWLRAVFESVQVGILLIDADSREIMEVNPQAAKLIGLPREKIIGKVCHKFTCPSDVGNCPVLDHGIMFDNTERILLCAEGNSLPVLKTVTELSLNGRVYLLESFLDISKRIQMEEQVEWQSEIIAGINRVFQESLASESDGEVAHVCLKVAEELTNSQLGVIGEFRPSGYLGYITVSDVLNGAPGIEKKGNYFEFENDAIKGALEEVFKNDQSVIINKPSFFAKRGIIAPNLTPVERFLGVPLKEGSKNIGIIGLANKDSDYTEEDLRAIEILSVAFLDALNRKRAQVNQQKTLREITLRNQIDDIFLKMPDEDVYGEVLYLVLGALGSKHGVFGYIDEKKVLVCPSLIRDAEAVDFRVKKLFQFPRSSWEGIWGKALVEKQPIYINKPSRVPWVNFQINRAIAVPILYRGQSIGLLFLGNKDTDYNPEDTEALETISTTIAPIIQARLEQKRLEVARSHAMNELERVQKDLRRIIDHANAPIFGVDPDGRVNEWNAMMAQLTGFSSAEAKDSPLVESWIPEIVQDTFREMLTKTLQGHGTKNFETPFRARDGTLVHLLLSSTTRWDEDRNVVGVVCVGQDLTELKQYRDHLEELIASRTSELEKINRELKGEIEQRIQTEVALREAMKRAEAASKAKSEFLANMSHELRTPMNSIIGFAEILSDGIPGTINDDQQDLIGTILTSGRHLLSLINTILDLARIESGKTELQVAAIQLKRLIETCLQTFEAGASERNITLQFDYLADSDEILADETKTIEIFNNLLSNAIKFTPEGGSVGITVEESQGEFTITIWDTGIGIAEENLDKLFQPFQQLENPYSKQFAGTGLGLHLTKRLVELQGGK